MNGGKYDRECPLPAFGQGAGGFSREKSWVGLYIPDLSGRAVKPGDQGSLATGIKNVRVFRILGHITAFASPRCIKPSVPFLCICTRRHKIPFFVGYYDGSVILLGPGHMIGEIAGNGDMIQLRRREVLVGPAFTSVLRHRTTAVIGSHHSHRIGWIDPKIVIVPMRRTDGLIEVHAAIGGLEKTNVQPVEGILIDRIRVDTGIIESPLSELAVFVDIGPGPASVVGARYTA